MSILKVAKRAGVSKSTVSRVINDADSVKASTREKVLATIKEMGYRPNVFAQGMKTNQSRTIALLIPDYSNPFFAALLAAIEKVLRPRNYMTMVFSGGVSEESELAALQSLVSRRVDGLVFHSYDRHEKTLQLMREINAKLPVVLMDQITKNSDISGVFVDGFKGTRDAVSHLIGKGRKRIAYVDAHHGVTRDRFEGYRQALADAGLALSERYVYFGDFSMESGLRASEYFLGLDPLPDAIVSATDNMAIGVMKGLLNKGIRVPEQINLIGYDNLAIAAMVEPSLSTIAIPIDDVVREVRRRLETAGR
ncbi:MAG: LacI family DNA-binding transcriptional regulator, partial [Propionivibrio sp.]